MGGTGSFYYVPKEVQKSVFALLGHSEYLKLPKRGTNPRGVQISAMAFSEILEHKDTFQIQVQWDKSDLEFDAYKRWLDM
ncbi:ThaI family type II restriction endonuclease [Sedimentisphaera salicampi]|uniref:ThaI family type II restriction endonuclease n=1 Tax=Sedimentisphaera salicampi TaxID=1941349 RepID=UPI000B9BCDCB|nr:ThaI family type II restriction endonuclease [Sedimentisphaera salicampi]